MSGAQVAGAPVDGAKSLFDNGLHSLRAVELVGKINRAWHPCGHQPPAAASSVAVQRP